MVAPTARRRARAINGPARAREEPAATMNAPDASRRSARDAEHTATATRTPSVSITPRLFGAERRAVCSEGCRQEDESSAPSAPARQSGARGAGRAVVVRTRQRRGDERPPTKRSDGLPQARSPSPAASRCEGEREAPRRRASRDASAEAAEASPSPPSSSRRPQKRCAEQWRRGRRAASRRVSALAQPAGRGAPSQRIR